MKKTTICKAIFLIMITNQSIGAKAGLLPGEIIGRDLDYPRIGWLGHVGLTAGAYPDQITNLVFEVLKSDYYDEVVNLHYITWFKTQSKYWGGRYGISKGGNDTNTITRGAANQRMFANEYTMTAQYRPATPNQTGLWRCDTFVAWTFAQAGHSEVFNGVMIPRNLFNRFPYSSNGLLPYLIDKNESTITIPLDKSLTNLSHEEINNMDFEEFSEIVNAKESTPDDIQKQWEFASNKEIEPIKRGAFFDKLAFIKGNKTVNKFISLYKNEKDESLKNKILGDSIIYYQEFLNKGLTDSEKSELLEFYKSLFDKMDDKNGPRILTGIIELSDEKYLVSNAEKINENLNKLSDASHIKLMISLSTKSLILEKMYIKNIIEFLKEKQSSDLDDIFLGRFFLQHEAFKDANTVPLIREYMDSIQEKYASDINSNLVSQDITFGLAQNSFNQLRELI